MFGRGLASEYRIDVCKICGVHSCDNDPCSSDGRPIGWAYYNTKTSEAMGGLPQPWM